MCIVFCVFSLSQFVNPEQEPRKRIRHQVSRQRSLTNTHMNKQNSIDSTNPGAITSPGVRRRLSKEKVIASKMIDMKKEKEDMLLSFENVPEESTEISRTNSSPIQSSQLQLDDNATNEYNHFSSNQSSSMDEAGEGRHSRMGSITGSGSPKNARRKGELSKKMLDRLHLFEISNDGGTVPPGPSSPHTSTPLNSPSVQMDDRKFQL